MSTPDAETPSFIRKIPAGDDRHRLVCDTCGWIHYENPKVVVGSVVVRGQAGAEEVLLCRRAIEPRRGYWTLPAGFLEEHESTEAGAMREAREEANADISIRALMAIYSIPRISQVQLIYLAELNHPEVSPGPESAAVAFFRWDDIPWADLAFPSVHWALRQYRSLGGRREFQPFTNPPGETGDRLPDDV
ncbi:MAG: NUDIX hydrolase [Alphaproteobacteria bacterium]|nr:MAG: NUDIX hydrolase [Alphaproteobacteria bacterium]